MKFHLENLADYITENNFANGAQYFYDGKITKIKRTEKLLTATVLGSKIYNVEISITKDLITDHNCTCPIDNNILCKHKVGLIIYLQEEKLKKMHAKKEKD